MIQVVGKKLLFVPYDLGGGVQAPAMEKELISAYTCPVCSNVIQAVFLTDVLVNVRLYEEIRTTIKVNEKGEVKIIRPGRTKQFKSRYRSTSLGHPGQVSAQVIQMEEHFEHHIGDERSPVCDYAAFFSSRAELPLNDMALVKLMPGHTVVVRAKEVKQATASIQGDHATRNAFRTVEDAGGRFPPLWLMRRTVEGYYLERALLAYRNRK